MRSHHRFLAAGLVLLAAIMVPPAVRAGTVTWNFHGHLTDNGAVPVAPIGTPLLLSVSLPLDTVDEDRLPEYVNYGHDGGTVGFGDTFLTTAARFPVDIYPYRQFQTLVGFADTPEVVDGHGLRWIGVTLINRSGPTGISEDLPLSFDLDAFDVRQFHVDLVELSSGLRQTVFGEIDRIEVIIADIPAPGMAGGLALAALLLPFWVRRRTARARPRRD